MNRGCIENASRVHRGCIEGASSPLMRTHILTASRGWKHVSRGSRVHQGVHRGCIEGASRVHRATAHTVPVRTVYRHRGRARSAIPLPRVRARARTRGKGIPCSRIRAIPYLLPKLGRREKALPQARAGGGAHLPPGMSQSSLAFEKIKQHPGPRHRQRRIAERGRRSDPIPSVP